MSLDLGSPAIEVAIALSFVFFLLSVIASAVAEWIAGILKLRANTLEEGVKGMLGDQGIAQQVLEHPLVRTDLEPRARRIGRKEKKERKPSYIAPANFALAFLDVVSRQPTGESRPVEDVKQTAAELGEDSSLGQQLGAMVAEADTSAARLRVVLEKWFDDSMERVSGWYTRKTRWITIGLAIVITLGLNASALRIGDRLATDPAVRAAVVSKAEKAVEEGKDGGEATEDIEKGEGVKPAGKGVESAYDELTALQLPILWADENCPFGKGWRVFWEALAGWLITIIAISLGAPFWFDALGKLANLRSAGKKPEPEK